MTTANNATAYQLAHWNDDLAPQHMVGCIISIALISIVIPLRIVAQSMVTLSQTGKAGRMHGKAQGYDVWKALGRLDTGFINIAAILALAVAACNIVALRNGLGKHQLRALTEDPHPPQRTALVFEMAYIITVIQASCIMFTKLSIIVFYQRIFARSNGPFKYVLWAVAAYCVLLGIASTVEFILACTPPSLFWNRAYLIFPDAKLPPGVSLEGHCQPTILHIVVPLFFDLASELALLVIPAIALWNVQLSLQKKVGLYLIFSLGGFTTAISVIRLRSAWEVGDSGDLTYIDADSFVWTTVQMSLAVVCACLPATAPLYRRIRSERSQNRSRGYGSTPWSRSGMTSGTGRDKSNKLSSDTASFSSNRELNQRPLHYGAADANCSPGSTVLDPVPLQRIYVAKDTTITRSVR